MQKIEITNFFVYSLMRLVRFAHEVAHARHNQVNLPLLSLNRNFRRLFASLCEATSHNRHIKLS